MDRIALAEQHRRRLHPAPREGAQLSAFRTRRDGAEALTGARFLDRERRRVGDAEKHAMLLHRQPRQEH